MPKPSDDGELLNNQLYNSRGLTLWQLKLEKPWLLHQQRRIQTNNGPSGNLTWRKYQSWHKSFTFLGDGLLSYLIAAGLSQPSWNSWSTGTTEGFFPRWVASTYQSLCVHLDLYEKSRSHVDFSQNQTSQVGCFFFAYKKQTNPDLVLFYLPLSHQYWVFCSNPPIWAIPSQTYPALLIPATSFRGPKTCWPFFPWAHGKLLQCWTCWFDDEQLKQANGNLTNVTN